ncbi:MAG: hypothetical protein CMH49_00665 [Myxococcales bacterium]|nr:hypothetical protein [Myxococcales bacterium]
MNISKQNQFSWLSLTLYLLIKPYSYLSLTPSFLCAQTIPIDINHQDNQRGSLEQNNDGQSLSYTAIDLYRYADRGHLQQVGPMLSPGAPGWGRHSNSTQLSRAFRPPQKHKGKLVSWIEGRGGTIYFPISETESQLDELLIWLQPIAAHQVVSIFVDEILIKNLSLQSKGRYYRLSLPKPLSQGEHSLRLYFRYTRNASWGGRTPGAIGPLSFVPKGQREQILDQWTGEIIHEHSKWGGLFAPPPCTWRFYLIPPEHADFKTTVYLPPLMPKTRFQVYVASDDRSDEILYDEVLGDPKSKLAISKDLKISLAAYVGKAVRLTLKTQELDHPHSSSSSQHKADRQTAWLIPRIDSLYPAPKDIPPIKRLIIWALDGIKLDPLMYTPRLREAFPSLKLLMDHGINFSRVWSKELDQREGHQLLLSPTPNQESLLASLNRLSGWSAYIGSTTHEQPQLDTRFDSTEYVDPQELDEHPYRGALMYVQQMSKLGKLLQERANLEAQLRLKGKEHSSKPELIYIHSPILLNNRKRSPFSLSRVEKNWIESFKLSSSLFKRTLGRFTQLKEIDYSLAQLMSELALSGLNKDTAILITGTAGLSWRFSTPKPKNLMQDTETSAILYHPNLNPFSPYLLDRAHLSALSDTLASFLITNALSFEQLSQKRGSLAPYILNKKSLPAFVDQAQKGNHFIVRMSDYYLFERPIGQPTLWRFSLADSIIPNQKIEDLSTQAPILLRTLRDGIGISPLIEGLR